MKTAPLLAASLAAFLASCGPSAPSAPAGESSDASGSAASSSVSGESAPGSAIPRAGQAAARPSVLLITVDTLRRDHLGCYGYFRDTSPRIDEFAEKGVLFERALASMASTYPSHLSMLTGMYPHQHGRTANKDGVKNPFRSIEGCASLAVALAAEGYRTAGFVSSTVLHSRTGIGEGFEQFTCPNPGQKPFKAGRISDAFLKWLDEGEGDERPFFAWTHYWDTHEPNSPPAEHLELFETTPELKARIAAAGIESEPLVREFEEDERVVERFFLGTPVQGGGRNRRRQPQKRPEYKADPASIEDLWNRYDADLHYIDASLGRVFDRLDAEGLWSSTIVIFVADHGQSLGEFNSFGHGLISNVNTFVPLIVRFPEGLVSQPLRVPELVSIVDLAPTILGRFGTPLGGAFSQQFEGEDLFSGAFVRRFALTQESTRFHKGGERGATFALLSGDWKFVRRETGSELYDLAGAGESVDVLAEHPDVEGRLNATLSTLLERVSATGSSQAPSEEEAEELLQNLEALGYGGD